MKAIFKAVLRDLYFHKGRSFITFFALFLVIAFPTAMFSTSPSIEYSISENNEKYHLTHLDLFVGPIHEDLSENITNTIKNRLGMPPERIMLNLNINSKLNFENTWYSVHTLGINSEKTLSINELEITEGNLDIKDGEIVLLDSFATHLNVSIGENLTLNFEEKSETFTIVGFVKSINYLSYELIQEGAVYVNEANLRDLLGLRENYYNEVQIYFSEDITDDELKDCSVDLREFFTENNIPINLIWHTRTVSYSAMLSDALNLTSSYLATSAILIIIIVGIVIFIITKRYAMEQRKQTGMLYSYGFSSKTIMAAFLLRTLVLSLFAIIFGSLAGWYILKILTSFLGNLWGLMNVVPMLSLSMILKVIISTFGVSLFFTFLAARENVSLTPYEAIRGKVKEFSQKRNFGSIIKVPMQINIPLRNVSRNKMRSVLTVLAFCGSVMLSFSLINTQTSLRATEDDYFTNLDWDVQVMFDTQSFSDSLYLENKDNDTILASEPYLQLNVQFCEQVDQITNLRGILANSTLINIDLQEGNGFSENIENEVILSQYSADKLGYTVGDECSFWLFDQKINVTIVGLSRTMDFPIAMYIQLETLENILGFLPVNGMLIDVEDLEIEEYSNELNENPDIQFALKKIKFENQIRKIVASQTVIVNIMVILGLIVSFLSIFSTTLIIIIEREREYALQRVFGFSTQQILMQIFLEIAFLALLALVLGYIAGLYLSIYWKNLVKENFFSIDSYLIWTDYALLFIFTIGASLFSLYPEYNSLQNQCLAEGIKKE